MIDGGKLEGVLSNWGRLEALALIAIGCGSGNETLIACDREDNELMGNVVFWEQAFYAVTQVENGSRIVEMRLPD